MQDGEAQTTRMQSCTVHNKDSSSFSVFLHSASVAIARNDNVMEEPIKDIELLRYGRNVLFGRKTIEEPCVSYASISAI